MATCGTIIANRTFCPPMNFTFRPKSNYSTFEYVTEVYFVMLLVIFGLVGNTLSFIIMQKDKERRESLFLLQILAVADTFYLILCFLRYSLKYFVPNQNHVAMQLYVFPLLKCAQTIAIWCMLLVTTDRYIFICMPLTARQIITTRSKRIMVFILFALAFAYNLPRFFENCIMSFVDPCTKIVISSMVYAPFFKKPLYFDIYHYAMHIIFLYLGPLSILTVLNASLILAIRKSRSRHRIPTNVKGNGCRRNGDQNTTVVLIIIIIIFIICETPELIMKLISLLNRHFKFMGENSSVFNRLSTISTLLMVTNSSVNFIVYVGYGKRFRRILKDMLMIDKCVPGRMSDGMRPLRMDEYNRDAPGCRSTTELTQA